MMRELNEATFDPAVLDAFFAIEAEILQIAARFRDEEESPAGLDRAEAAMADEFTFTEKAVAVVMPQVQAT